MLPVAVAIAIATLNNVKATDKLNTHHIQHATHPTWHKDLDGYILPQQQKHQLLSSCYFVCTDWKLTECWENSLTVARSQFPTQCEMEVLSAVYNRRALTLSQTVVNFRFWKWFPTQTWELLRGSAMDCN